MPTPGLYLAAVLCGWLADPPAAAGQRAEASAAIVFPFEIALEVARLETLHRSILRGPADSWQLESVRTGYESAITRTSNTEVIQILQARLDAIAAQAEVARSSRRIATLMSRSKRRDAEIAEVNRKLAALSANKSHSFVAQGRLQPSSRQVDGHRVYALIGRAGSPIAYLDVPAGLDTRKLTAKRVGVRGHVRYNEGLGNRLIAVRDLEALE